MKTLEPLNYYSVGSELRLPSILPSVDSEPLVCTCTFLSPGHAFFTCQWLSIPIGVLELSDLPHGAVGARMVTL